MSRRARLAHRHPGNGRSGRRHRLGLPHGNPPRVRRDAPAHGRSTDPGNRMGFRPRSSGPPRGGAAAQHRGHPRRRPRLERPDVARRRCRRRHRAHAAHRLHRPRRRSFRERLRGQRHLCAIARRPHDRALRHPLRLRVHPDASRLQHDGSATRQHQAGRASQNHRPGRRPVDPVQRHGRAPRPKSPSPNC